MDNVEGPIFFIMGVSGSGKTTIGKLFAEALSVPFFDGDDYHSESNVSKMAAGHPLTDEDRKGWLLSLNNLAKDHQSRGAVIVSSALKAEYRRLLSSEIEDRVTWVLLQGSFDLIQERLQKRKGHFMPAKLLKSQFETLEIPQNAITLSIIPPPEEIVVRLLTKIGKV
jgi:gluconokinase